MLTEITRSTPLTSAAHASRMFPRLTSAQIARIASYGVIRPITRGEVLVEDGQTDVPFFVVKAGEIEIIRHASHQGLPQFSILELEPAWPPGELA